MEDKLSLKEKMVKDQFELLREHIGEKVVIEYYHYGRLYKEIITLREVYDYSAVLSDSQYFPFIGYGSAIKSISLAGKVLYEAKGLIEPYDIRDELERIAIVRCVFGNHEANKAHIAYEKEKKREEEAKIIEQQKIAQFKKEELPQLLITSKPYIIPEKFKEWKKTCIKNSNDIYGIAIMKMIVDLLVEIGKGTSFDKAITDICDEKHGTSGFAMGIAASMVVSFSIFGDEFKKYWNSQYTDEECEGVINPAVISIEKKSKSKK